MKTDQYSTHIALLCKQRVSKGVIIRQEIMGYCGISLTKQPFNTRFSTINNKPSFDKTIENEVFKPSFSLYVICITCALILILSRTQKGH